MPENKLPHIWVGCQAWTFDDWKTLRGGPTIFFPPGIKNEEKLSFYGKIFDTVEVDSTFYAIPKLSTLESWHKQVPEHFKFALKMPKEVTHIHSLSEASFPLAGEFVSRLAGLKNKTAVALIQLPESFKMNAGTKKNLDAFLNVLPRQLRFAIEFRSPEWFVPEIFDLLAKQNTAVCLGQNKFLSREQMLKALDAPSADFAYFRFSGLRDLVKLDRVQRPQNESMDFWLKRVEETQAKGRECFVYFSNLFEGFSPASAMKFRRMLGQEFVDPEELNEAPSLF